MKGGMKGGREGGGRPGERRKGDRRGRDFPPEEPEAPEDPVRF
ncbi:MAG: hypothetical protein ACYTKD_22305 [Planctomycetota bacterium]|jgi:hypothetical protein